MSLMAWYKLNSDFKDYSGNNYNGAQEDGTSLVFKEGKINGSVEFSTADYSRIGIPNFDLSGSKLTICYWEKFIQNPNRNLDQAIFQSGINNDWKNPSGGIVFGRGYGFDYYFGIQGNPVLYGYNMSYITENNWNHFTWVIDATNGKLELFINGVYKTEWSFDPAHITCPNKKVFIGHDPYRGGLFKGQLEDFRIYNECLSKKEIKEISQAKFLHYDFSQSLETTQNLYNSATHSHSNQGSETPFPITPPVDKIINGGTWGGLGWGGDINIGTVSAGESVTFSGWVLFWSTDVSQMNDITRKPFLHFHSSLESEGDWFINSNEPNNGWNKWHYFTFTKTITTTSNNWRIEDGGFDYYETDLASLTSAYWCNVQIEKKDHATEFVKENRTVQIKDKSGWENHSLEIELSKSPTWSKGINAPGNYEFFSNEQIKLPSLNNPLEQYTICFWEKRPIDSFRTMPIGTYNNKNFFWHSTYAWYYCHGELDDEFCYGYEFFHYFNFKDIVEPENEWHHKAVTFNGSQIEVFIDGISQGTKQAVGYSKFGNLALGINYGPVVNNYDYNFTGELEDYRMYATSLSIEEINKIKDEKGSLDKKMNLLSCNVKQQENLFSAFNYTIEDKTWQGGTGAYQQSNCVVTIKDEGINVFRTPNLQYPEAGTVMWGGLTLSIPEGTFEVGRKYKIKMEVKGVSSNGIKDIHFAYEVAWSSKGGLGAASVITDINLNGLNRTESLNTNGEWITLEIAIEPTRSEMYKFGNGTDGISASIEYYKMRQLKIGHGYEDTGALGTDLTYRNFRLYDITDETGEFSIQRNGEHLINEISEVGITDGLIAWWPLKENADDYSGSSFDVVVNGAILSAGNDQTCYLFDGVDDYINTEFNQELLTGDFTVSLWVKMNNPGIGKYDGLFGNHGGATLGFGLQWRAGVLNPFYGDGTNWQGWGNFTVGADISEWSLVTIVYKPGTEIQKWVNGELLESRTASGSFAPFYDFRIGIANDVVDRFSNCKIQDVRIYNRALGSQEIKINYDLTNNKKAKVSKNGTFYVKEIKEVV